MFRIVAFIYGLAAYVMFHFVFLYILAFFGNIYLANTLDSAATAPFWPALAGNLGLCLLFGLQHSVMARPTFKQWWTKFVPQPIERSTYVLCSNLAMLALMICWQPLGGTIWRFESPLGQGVCYGLFAIGGLTILLSTFLLGHFDLFGVRQVWLYLRGEKYTHAKFSTPGFYKYVRHPLYVGWLLTVWATPTMTTSHLVFAVCMTAYMLVAIQFEERNLIDVFGKQYLAYRREVPMLIPRITPYGQEQKQQPQPARA